MSSSATGVGMTICFLGAILLILTQKSSQKFGDVLGIFQSIPHPILQGSDDGIHAISRSKHQYRKLLTSLSLLISQLDCCNQFP